MKLAAKLAFISVPSDMPQKSRAFFEKLLGIDLVPALSTEETYHAPISSDAIDLNVTKRHAPQEQMMAWFGVDDLNSAITQVQQSGGKVVWGPENLNIAADDFPHYQESVEQLDSVKVTSPHLASAVVVLEPGGSQVGLVQVADHAKAHYKVGRYYQPLTPYQEKVHTKSMETARKARKWG